MLPSSIRSLVDHPDSTIVVFGPVLQPGRRVAIERMALQPGSRILEIGVGTALDASLYPDECEVVGIDVSAGMLDKARERIRSPNSCATSASYGWTPPTSPSRRIFRRRLCAVYD